MTNPENLLSSPSLIANDIGRWRVKRNETRDEAIKRTIEEWAGAASEQRKAEYHERINFVELVVHPDGFRYLDQKDRETPNWQVSRIGVENEATYQIWHWARELDYRDSQKDDECIVWISPSGRGYTESRINVYKIFYSFGDKILFFWSIPTPHTPEQCLQIANQIQDGRFDNSETLRQTPVKFRPPSGILWTKFLGNIVKMPKVWQAIENGEPEKEKQEALRKVTQIVEKHYDSFLVAGDDVDKQIRAGATVELAIQEHLQMEFMPVGGHGMSNIFASSLLSQNVPKVGASKKEGENKKWIEKCPYCHVSIKQYMASGDLLACCGHSVP